MYILCILCNYVVREYCILGIYHIHVCFSFEYDQGLQYTTEMFSILIILAPFLHFESRVSLEKRNHKFRFTTGTAGFQVRSVNNETD